MYNRPMYMQEGGFAGSFGSSINPSFGGNGLLENIQEQVSKNGEFLQLIQNKNQGTNTALSTQNPSTPNFSNSDGSSAIDNLINNDPLFPKPKPAELTAQQPMSIANAATDSQSQLRADYDKAVEDARRQRAEGFMGRVVLPGEMSFEDFKQAQIAVANSGQLQSKIDLDFANSGINLQPSNFNSIGDGINNLINNNNQFVTARSYANGGLADMGRFGDNQMVHAQTGEMVVPQSILQENPQIGMGLNQALVNQGLDPQRQIVGSNAGSINPMTGQQEFFDLGKLLKKAAPIAIGAMLGPAAGAGLGGLFGAGSTAGSFLSNPFVSRALTGAITSKLGGAKTKDALMAGLLSGGIGALTGGSEASIGSDATKQGASQAGTVGKSLGQGISRNQAITDAVSKTATDVAAEGVKKAFVPKTMSGELLQSLGVSEDNLLSKLLNTQMGEGLSAGLIAQLLAGGDEDEDTRTAYERRPFGFGGPGGKLGGITYANMGGEMGFPRRNGGIDPSEGSGRKDDVPAMLMAGEFVLTKDAVKGLGDGNQRKGIQRAYNMMDNLEARA